MPLKCLMVFQIVFSGDTGVPNSENAILPDLRKALKLLLSTDRLDTHTFPSSNRYLEIMP